MKQPSAPSCKKSLRATALSERVSICVLAPKSLCQICIRSARFCEDYENLVSRPRNVLVPHIVISDFARRRIGIENVKTNKRQKLFYSVSVLINQKATKLNQSLSIWYLCEMIELWSCNWNIGDPRSLKWPDGTSAVWNTWLRSHRSWHFIF